MVCLNLWHFLKLLLFGLVASLIVAAPVFGQTPVVRQELHHDVSPPLRDLAANPPTVLEAEPREADEMKVLPLPPGFKPANEPDLALQKTAATLPVELTPTAGLNFEGLGSGFSNYKVNSVPPDTNGAVGATQYVQWVNLSFAVFDKATGNVLPNFPVPGNTLWQGFGGGCETNNDGDPIVTYDKLADRWVFTQLAVRGLGTFLQCVAVSTSSDATGTYNRYSFEYQNVNDYPKLGVWPDAYYITFNMFGGSQFSFLGAQACAYDRNAMLNGQAATQVCFPPDPSVLGLLPADVDGLVPPPAGSPNFMLSFDVNSLKLFKFHVDFANPANSTLSPATNIAVTPFTPFLCNGGTSFACVPQPPPGSSTLLDSLGDRLMYRLAYRNFGDHESLLVNHSVIADPVKLNSGIRWYEIQNPSGTPTVAQQSTFAPDANFRWMGSAAMDVSGDLAVGYSVSSAALFPSIAFAARASSDPASTLQAETTLFSGTGSQTTDSLGNPLTRWGDYSAMQIDPVDDCTFWYTTEYLAKSGIFNWNTRIANFKFLNCGAVLFSIALSHTGNFTQGQSGSYTINVTNRGGRISGIPVTVTDTLPAGLTFQPTAASGTGWTCSPAIGSTVSCNRADDIPGGTSLPPITVQVNADANAPALVTNTATVSVPNLKDLVHNTASDPTTIIQTGPDLGITKTHSGPFILGQTGTYTLTVSNVGLSSTDGTKAVTVTDTLPTGLTFNAASGTGWSCPPPTGQTVSCTRTDVLPKNQSYPAITLTVNVAANAPALVVNTASVAGGGDVNPLNDNASDPTKVIPPPPVLTITKNHSGNFNQGQQGVQYTLTVTNASGGPTSGLVTVTDTLPTGLTVNAVNTFPNGWFCTANTTANVSCQRSDVLAVGSSYPPITLSVNVDANAPASVINTATVSGGSALNSNTASDATTINPAPTLVVSKIHTVDPFIVGKTGTYTITVSNVGHAPTSGFVNVNDFLPFGSMTATNISGPGWVCSAPPTSSVSCTRTDALAAGSSYPPITVAVSVTGGGPSVTNTVNVSGGGAFNFASASDLTHITAPVLAITKSHTGDFTVGTPGVYTITVSNTGPIATVGTVTVNDFLPFGMTAATVSGAGWSCPSLPTQFLTCSRSDSLPPNTSYPALNVTVNITNANPTVVNTANVQGGGDSTTRSASDSTNINTPTLAVSKTHSGNFVVGLDGIYEITVSNTGKVATVGTVSLQDFLPSGLTAIAAGGPGWTCSQVPTSFLLTCTRSDSLAVGASYPVLIVTVNVGSAGSTVTNSVNVTGGGDAATHSASDTANVTGPTLKITKSHSGTFTAGQNGTYTINVSNVGTVATSGTVTVQDFLPFGLTATQESGAGWSCPTQPVTFLTCTRSDSLSPGSSYPALIVTVSLATSGAVTNTASVTGGGDAANHTASDTTTINPGPILSITKTHTGDFTVGQPGSYTITVGNTGTVATNGLVTVQDFLPFVFSATAVSGSGWSCNPLPTTFLTCTRSDALNPGSSYPALVVTVSVNGGAPSVTNSASVSGGGDSQSHNANDPTNVIGPTIGITKSHSPDPFVVGQTGTYTITVDNKAGKGPTGGTVTVQDFLPTGLSASAITGSGWSCTPPTSFITCTRSDSIAAGATYPAISVTVNVNGGGPSVTNTATVSGGGDSFSHNASDTTKITAPVLAITKTHTPDPFVAGQQGTYTITVSNTGTVATVGTASVIVTDNLPIGLTLASTNGTTSGWGCLGTTSITCTRSDSLAAGASYPALVLTVNIGNSVATIVNTASVTGGGDSLTHTANDTVNVTVPLLAITKSHSGNFTVGQPGTYTINVSNAGSVPTAGTVTVTDFLPFSLDATAVSGTGWGCSPLPTQFLTCTRSDSLAASSSYPPLQVTVSVSGGTANVTNTASVTGGGDGLNHNAGDPTTIITPTLAISKSHSGAFTVGQPASYMITVSNSGTVPTSGTVTVTDSLPAGLTASSITAVGWQCPTFGGITFVNCTRSDILAGGASYPPITLNVTTDPNAPSSLVNQATVSGGGDPLSHTAVDTTTITLPDLAVTASHTGNFFVGEQGASYTINVSNVGSLPTAGGTLTVVDPLPIGLAATSASGSGWACNIFNGPQTEVDCTRPAGVLNQGSSYPPITVAANVAFSAPATLTNSVSLFGIGESNYANNTASDPTTILPIEISSTSSSSVTVTAGSSATYTFQVNLGTNPPPGTVSFSITGLPPNSTVSFAPSSIMQTGAMTMTLNTSGNGHVASLPPRGFVGFTPIYAAVLLPVLGLLVIGMRDKQRRKWALLGVSLCGVILALSFAGCGGGSGPGTPTPTPTPIPTPTPVPTPTPTPPPSTPPGTYTITVTATGPNGTASAPVTLIVQ